MERVVELYKEYTGSTPVSLKEVAAAGSSRHYYILDGTQLLVGTEGSDKKENEAFVYMASHFAGMGLPVPQVVAVAPDGLCYLQTFAGNLSLFDCLASSRQTGEYTEQQIALLQEAVRILARFHSAGTAGFDFGKCIPRGSMDARSVLWDLNYFKYCFLKPACVEFDEDALENDFELLANRVGSGGDSIILRDCQSRNIMVGDDGRLTFIDFQGARRGKGIYDVVSLLWQARAAFPSWLKEKLVDEYIAARGFNSAQEAEFRAELPLYVLLRTMQVLGAYGFRGLVEHKEHFVRSIPAAIDNVKDILEGGIPGMPALTATLCHIVADNRFGHRAQESGALVVKVCSFAYKMGLPVDDSGNGGGFVFDCRGLHNPGRYDEYKPLTGRDEAVISFLEERGEMQPYLEHAFALVDSTVERYIARGFTSLSVAFGCTGGRHRSVYCAEAMARHLSARFGVRVELSHREQKINEIFEQR